MPPLRLFENSLKILERAVLVLCHAATFFNLTPPGPGLLT
jgi:hypothetical protein